MDVHDKIRIRGAAENNLCGFDLELPRNVLVVVTGVSGSGKSSLAFDTIYREGSRRYLETFSAYARQFLGRLKRSDVEEISGLPPALAVAQKKGTAGPRSTVGTLSGILDYVRLFYARAGTLGCPECGEGHRYPYGPKCTRCGTPLPDARPPIPDGSWRDSSPERPPSA